MLLPRVDLHKDDLLSSASESTGELFAKLGQSPFGLSSAHEILGILRDSYSGQMFDIEWK